jgi:hypothetical protein
MAGLGPATHDFAVLCPEKQGVAEPDWVTTPACCQTPTITSEAFTTAKAFIPGFNASSSAASLVMDAVIVTSAEIAIVTWVVVAPGFTVLIVPAI